MDSAKDLTDGSIVSAFELWDLGDVEKDRYVCRGCSIRVFPASYRRNENKVSPYFATPRGARHESDCEVSGTERLLAQPMTRRLSLKNGLFPKGYPNKVVFRDERPIVSPEPVDAQPAPARRTAVASTTDGHLPQRERSFTVGTIRLPCQYFVGYAGNRKDLVLEVPGVRRGTYDGVFRRLKYDRVIHYSTRHIFYARIQWTTPPRAETASLLITLHHGDREAKRLGRPYVVRIGWADRQRGARDAVHHELEDALAKADESRRVGGPLEPWLFLVGNQEPGDDANFVVRDHRLICSLAAKVISPAWSKPAPRPGASPRS